MLKSVKRKTKSLEFVFSDSASLDVPNAWLRSKCACALCLAKGSDEIPMFSSSEQLNEFYRVASLEKVGNYAFAVTWGDKHRSLYSFDRVFHEFRNLELPPHLKAVQVKSESL